MSSLQGGSSERNKFSANACHAGCGVVERTGSEPFEVLYGEGRFAKALGDVGGEVAGGTPHRVVWSEKRGFFCGVEGLRQSKSLHVDACKFFERHPAHVVVRERLGEGLGRVVEKAHRAVRSRRFNLSDGVVARMKLRETLAKTLEDRVNVDHGLKCRRGLK